MRKSIPDYSVGEEEGMENWVARFRWEYSWPVTFEAAPENHDDRKAFTGLDVEAIVAAMETDTAADVQVPVNLSQATAAGPTDPAHAKKRSSEGMRTWTPARASGPM